MDGQQFTNVPSVSTGEKRSWSTIITLIVIIGVLIIGAFYVWGERISEERERAGYPATENEGPQS